MHVVVDTSVILAVLLGEPERNKLISLTQNCDLLAPHSLHWEIGNAFSAMFKRGRISLKAAQSALKNYLKIPVRLCEIDLLKALEIAKNSNIYAYDAYMIECARNFKAPLLTLDSLLKENARKYKVSVMEVEI